MYPKGAYEIVGFPVNPGDQISADVEVSAKGTFTLTIINKTEDKAGNPNATFSITQRLQSAQCLSAEWVMEAPWWGGVLPLADFDTIGFLNCSATTSDGHTGAINDSAWQYDEMTMETSSGTVKAQPSSLSSGGTSFGVTWYHE